MELQNPNDVAVSGSTLELLSQVSDAVARLAEYRPFKPEVEDRLREALLPDRVVASLNMEGIIATRRQTLAVMDAMRINESIDRSEIEIRNALMADEFVHDAVTRGLPLNEHLVREINRLLIEELRQDAGAFRAGQVELPGAPFLPPNPGDVPDLVNQLCNLFATSESAHPVVQAAWLHEQFTLIHPFSDGNGRGGRLLQDWALMRRGYMPIGIPPSRRDDYYAALESADKGEWDDFVEILCMLQLDVIKRVEAIAQEPDKRAGWVGALAAAAASKHENTQHKQYVVWRQRMESISEAFKLAADELDAASDVIGTNYRDFGVVDFKDWDSMCRRGIIDRSWAFSLLFFAEGRAFYKTIAFFKRHEAKPCDPFDWNRNAIGLFFTGTVADPPDGVAPRPNFVAYEDPHIRLREIVFIDDAMFVYTQANPEADWACEDCISIGSVVEQFFTDMFGRKAGLDA